MARHTTLRQQTPSDQEDKFVVGVLEATNWSRRHGRLLLAFGVALLVAILGFLYYRSWRGRLESQASNQLVEARQIAASGNIPLATRQLNTLIATYGGTRAAAEGRLLLAQTELDAGQAQSAVKAVQPVASDLGSPLGTPAAMLLAAAYEQANEIPQAEATYLRIADGARFDYQRRDALEGAARLKLQHGDAAGAAALYTRLLESLPDTAVARTVYEMRLGEAQAEAQAAKPAGK